MDAENKLHEHDGDDEEDGDKDDGIRGDVRPRSRGPGLRDQNGYCYFGDAKLIHALLDVMNYIPVVPLAPPEELHASSVQHPRFPTMRWLLHTRRVPVLQSTDSAADGADDARPRCAGVGREDVPCWLCHHCASHLCSQNPRMPPQALANWNWGGREHPKYQTLSVATKSLLGLGKLVSRMILLKPTGDAEDSEKALVGNTILVAQPSPEMIAAELPQTEDNRRDTSTSSTLRGPETAAPPRCARRVR